eukprot:UN27783
MNSQLIKEKQRSQKLALQLKILNNTLLSKNAENRQLNKSLEKSLAKIGDLERLRKAFKEKLINNKKYISNLIYETNKKERSLNNEIQELELKIETLNNKCVNTNQKYVALRKRTESKIEFSEVSMDIQKQTEILRKEFESEKQRQIMRDIEHEKNDLLKENEKLRKENEKLKNYQLLNIGLQSENTSMKSELGKLKRDMENNTQTGYSDKIQDVLKKHLELNELYRQSEHNIGLLSTELTKKNNEIELLREENEILKKLTQNSENVQNVNSSSSTRREGEPRTLKSDITPTGNEQGENTHVVK